MHQFLIHADRTLANMLHDPEQRDALARLLGAHEAAALLRAVDLTDPVVNTDAVTFLDALVAADPARLAWTSADSGQRTLLDANGEHIITVTV
jgi:hypothetical protein